MNNIETDFMRDVGTKFIYPVYQPIVNGHRRIVGFEMLIRWCVNGVEKQPQDFLPYFNEKKLSFIKANIISTRNSFNN